MKCGKRKVWMDPNEISEISTANSRQNVRKLVKDSLIIRKPDIVHSRARVNARHEAKSKGRHMGPGKRKGTRNARLPQKVLWIRRMRVLRRMLKKYREAGKIDRSLYHELYLQVKGARHKTKKQLMETVHRLKGEKQRMQALKEQAAVAKQRAEIKRRKREERERAKREALLAADQ